jgi:hypothetical protein
LKISLSKFRKQYWQKWAIEHDYDPNGIKFVPKPFTDGYDVFVEGE